MRVTLLSLANLIPHFMTAFFKAHKCIRRVSCNRDYIMILIDCLNAVMFSAGGFIPLAYRLYMIGYQWILYHRSVIVRSIRFACEPTRRLVAVKLAIDWMDAG